MEEEGEVEDDQKEEGVGFGEEEEVVGYLVVVGESGGGKGEGRVWHPPWLAEFQTDQLCPQAAGFALPAAGSQCHTQLGEDPPRSQAA